MNEQRKLFISSFYLKPEDLAALEKVKNRLGLNTKVETVRASLRLAIERLEA